MKRLRRKIIKDEIDKADLVQDIKMLKKEIIILKHRLDCPFRFDVGLSVRNLTIVDRRVKFERDYFGMIIELYNSYEVFDGVEKKWISEKELIEYFAN